MPNIMVFPTTGSAGSNLASVINLMIAEIKSVGENSNAIIDRLSDILFIEAIRTYMQLDNRDQGYIAVMKDPRLGKALTSFHNQPAINWTVQFLSKEAGMSRSSFADKFKQMLDMSPMEYVQGWRMQQAYEALASGDNSVMQIAEDCGYQSEAAFGKAFKKQFGIGPGTARRNAQEQSVSANSKEGD